jgi:hypothetical protein
VPLVKEPEGIDVDPGLVHLTLPPNIQRSL